MGEQMELYICTRCNLLLTRLDARYVQYESATLNELGEYAEHENGESDFDYYLCPICSGTSVDIGQLDDGKGGTYDSKTLNPVRLPITVAKQLVEMQDTYFELNKDTKEAYLYHAGIPLGIPGLKEMLLEGLLT